MKNKIRISGTGCALADFVYNGIDFSSSEFKKYISKKDGDGGLFPGKLVFTEELEKFANKSYPEIILDITKNKEADIFNVGGPSIVALIHAAQILPADEYDVDFYGISGMDETSNKIRELLRKTPIGYANYTAKSKMPTPFTHVLSDPDFDGGNGERTFINNIGAAWELTPEELPDDFFDAEIVCFGGTALTPNIHDNLNLLLKKTKKRGAITVVNTVYDFKNEKQNPQKKWPLGNSEESFPNIDILIMDNEEANRISGYSKITDVTDYFSGKVSAFIITRGSNTILFNSNGKTFKKDTGELAVSQKVFQQIQTKKYTGDTTGCGDNFVGGVIVSIAKQIKELKGKLDLKESVISGICAGGFACSYTGGAYFEKEKGEKNQQICSLIEAYKNQ